MLSYLITRIMSVIPVALGVVILVASLAHFIPGDPVDVLAGEFATDTDKEQMRQKLGLNRPIAEQIAHYLVNLSRGNLGVSLMSQKPVASMMRERLLPTLELAFAAMLVAISISIPLGIFSALKKGSFFDFAAMGAALIGIAMPTFWLGPILVLVFALKLDLLPVSERGDLSHYVLPALTMGTALAAILSRMTRNSVLDHFKEDYVRTAKAKGVSPSKILFKHVLRNASLPLVTVIGLQFGVLLTGAIITERIFDWPGLGSLIIEALQNRDYPVIQGCVLLFAFSYLFVNMITDIAYGLIDPRIKLR